MPKTKPNFNDTMPTGVEVRFDTKIGRGWVGEMIPIGATLIIEVDVNQTPNILEMISKARMALDILERRATK